MSCELNYKTVARPLSTLEPMVYTNSCVPCEPVCKVQTPCKKVVKVCEPCPPVCPPVVSTCNPVTECVEVCEKPCSSWNSSGWWGIILTFIIVFIISWFLLYSLKPTAVLNVDANGVVIQPPTVNGGKVVVYSIIIALIVCLLLWAFRNSFRY